MSAVRRPAGRVHREPGWEQEAMTRDEGLAVGREAFERRSWHEAVEVLAKADDQEPRGPADLMLLAESAWWIGRPEDATEALERAFSGYADAGESVEAALVAVQLSYLAFRRMAVPVAVGWVTQIEQLIAGEPESEAHAWLKMLNAAAALFIRQDMDEAIRLGDEAIEISQRQGSVDARAIAQSNKAQALISRGDWEEGLALIDESTAAAVSGVLDLRIASDVYCNTIAACRNTADFGRAGEWTEEADRWMRRHSLGGYPGVCRVHRAELKRMRGAWSEAEQEARLACEELERFRILDPVGLGHYEIGEVRLRMGDLDAAEESFGRAYEWGRSGQPGLALVMLARGDVDGAAEAITRAVQSRSGGDDTDKQRLVARIRLLPALAKIAVAGNDLETANAAVDEMELAASRFDRPAFEAAALTARGAVHLLEGTPAEAADALDRAWRLWREIEFPYESAEARALLGRAHGAAGDPTSAHMDLQAARTAFERLGAARDVDALNDLLGDDGGAGRDGRRVTRTFMFTDIVTSTDLVELIGDGAWEDLLHWHDKMLRSAFTEHRGDVVSGTGDGFFVAFDTAGDAVECAVAIQRRLAAHRREHGFAPFVRIGFHTAEATPQGRDYVGRGVHVAARVGALGERDDIVMSVSARDAAGVLRFPVSEGREVTLKGVTEPVEVFTIDWR